MLKATNVCFVASDAKTRCIVFGQTTTECHLDVLDWTLTVLSSEHASQQLCDTAFDSRVWGSLLISRIHCNGSFGVHGMVRGRLTSVTVDECVSMFTILHS